MRTNQNHTAGVEVVLPMKLEKARRPAMCKRQKQERPLVALVRRTRRKRGKRTMMSVRSARLTEPICRGTEASVSKNLTDRSVHVWSRPKLINDRSTDPIGSGEPNAHPPHEDRLSREGIGSRLAATFFPSGWFFLRAMVSLRTKRFV
jgi:hypothetical protein